MNKPIVGTWVIEHPTNGSRIESIYREDGTYSYSSPSGVNAEGTYSVFNNILTSTNQYGTNVVKFEIDGDYLSLFNANGESLGMPFRREE
jgi:hypothetical protein